MHFLAYLIWSFSQDLHWDSKVSAFCPSSFWSCDLNMLLKLGAPFRVPGCLSAAAWDSLQWGLQSLTCQSFTSKKPTLTVNPALQLKKHQWRPVLALLIQHPSGEVQPFPGKCTQGLVWLPLNSLLCTVRANLSCMKQEMVLLWQQSTF